MLFFWLPLRTGWELGVWGLHRSLKLVAIETSSQAAACPLTIPLLKKKLPVSRGLGLENHGDDSVVFLHQASCGAGSLVPLRPCPEIQLSVNRPGQRCPGGCVHVGEWG